MVTTEQPRPGASQAPGPTPPTRHQDPTGDPETHQQPRGPTASKNGGKTRARSAKGGAGCGGVGQCLECFIRAWVYYISTWIPRKAATLPTAGARGHGMWRPQRWPRWSRCLQVVLAPGAHSRACEPPGIVGSRCHAASAPSATLCVRNCTRCMGRCCLFPLVRGPCFPAPRAYDSTLCVVLDTARSMIRSRRWQCCGRRGT